MSETITAEFRTALRKRVTADPRWDEYRKARNLSLATMVKADWQQVMRDFGIRGDDLALDVNASRSGIALAASPQNISNVLANAGIATPANYPEPSTMTTPRAVATAKADFAQADEAPEFDHTDIPAVPLPITAAQLAKIDSIIALAVDPDISFKTIYDTARRAVFCADSLKTTLEFERANVVTARDPHAAIVKSSLDFVAPSWSRDFLDYLDIGATVAVVGPSGNGKTTGARKLLERAGWTVYEFDCTDATLPQDLIGRTALRQENGATVTDWTAGPIALAFADPKGAVLLNEYDALDPRTGMALQSALEAAQTRRVSAPDTGEQLRSHGPCPIVLTLNTIGHGATVEYQGRNALDGANRDRVEIIVTGYEHEAEILVAHGFAQETAERLAAWAGTARAKLATMNSREILSNRRLLTAAALMDRRAASLTDAVQKAFVCRMAPREAQAFAA